jgi:hypothetical protein
MAVVSDQGQQHVAVTDAEIRTLQLLYYPNGEVWANVLFSNDAVALTPMRVDFNEDGMKAIDIADDTDVYFVGVSHVAKGTDTIGWIQIGGPVDDMVIPSLSVTKGYGLTIVGGAVASYGAAYQQIGAGHVFAVARETIAAATAIDTYLIPLQVHGTT